MFYKIRYFIRKHFIGYRPGDMPCLDYLEYLESKGEGTMKVIDLLNKIANGEEVPKKIKVNNDIYEYRSYMYCTEKANYQDIEDYLFGKWNFNILNEEVEIIEEDKKIEKLESFGLANDNPMMTKVIALIANKIDEIIDVINRGD